MEVGSAVGSSDGRRVGMSLGARDGLWVGEGVETQLLYWSGSSPGMETSGSSRLPADRELKSRPGSAFSVFLGMCGIFCPRSVDRSRDVFVLPTSWSSLKPL